MWASTSSSEICPIGLKRAIEITSEAGAEADLSPGRDRPLVPAQDHDPVPVEDAREGDRDHLDRDERSGDVCEAAKSLKFSVPARFRVTPRRW